MSKLYTVDDIAALAGVSGDTVRSWLKSGRLVGFKLTGDTQGAAWRIEPRDWEHFIEVRRAAHAVDDA